MRAGSGWSVCSKIVGQQEHHANSDPKKSFDPVAGLECFEKADTKKQNEDGKIRTESYFHYVTLLGTASIA